MTAVWLHVGALPVCFCTSFAPLAPLPSCGCTPADPTYSTDFFDNKHYVLKGASWATDTTLVRASFRNFYQARYPYVFSKFRVVYDRPTAAWGG